MVEQYRTIETLAENRPKETEELMSLVARQTIPVFAVIKSAPSLQSIVFPLHKLHVGLHWLV